MNKKVILELVGIDGNAYSIMGAWKQAARRQGWTEAECKVVLDEAMSGDYNHLLATIIGYTKSPDEDDSDCEFFCDECGDEGCENCQ